MRRNIHAEILQNQLTGCATTLCQNRGDPLTDAAHTHTILQHQHRLFTAKYGADSMALQRCDTVQLYHTDMVTALREQLCRRQSLVDQHAISNDRTLAALTKHRKVLLAAASGIGALTAAGIANSHRALRMEHGAAQHGAELGKAGRTQHRHAGDLT